MTKLLYIKCLKEVAEIKGRLLGLTTWFPVCSECLYNVRGWSREELEKANKNLNDENEH